ncbi:MAG: ATP-dependent Clp protease adaptor ClpS [Dehalococcoidia bacterium]|nr:ATP-dependent Clp protease adaptor ClpS [Dehalococcoidia bacterium]
MTSVTRPGIDIFDQVDELLDPPYHLILLNDDEHTYQYVIHMLGAVFGYGPEKAFAIACMVDSQGQAVVMTGSHDEVRRKQDQVHAFGADPFLEICQGSMSAVIEPAC